MVYPVPQPGDMRGVPLTVCALILTALPLLWILAIVTNPPREFGIILLFGALFCWIPARGHRPHCDGRADLAARGGDHLRRDSGHRDACRRPLRLMN